MINTVIFDIGKVLVGYNWDAFFERELNGDAELIVRMRNVLFGDHFWDEVDRGAISDEEILERYYHRAPDLKDEILRIWGIMGGEVKMYDYTAQWITDLRKRGYRVLYLSNWSNHFMKDCWGELSKFVPLMDGGVFSCDVKQIKPDEDIFKTIIGKYSLTPENCVFLDDRKDNIAAAISLGFNGIVVESQEQAVKALDELLAKS